MSIRLSMLLLAIHSEGDRPTVEWSAHEPAGLRQGLEQSVIDLVKYDRDVKVLPSHVHAGVIHETVPE
jgi:hypothetical protein